MSSNKLHNNIKTGFKTPDNYFKTFEDHLLSELKLKEQAGKTGFAVPNDYFDTFKIDSQPDHSKTKVISLFNNKNLLYAASIAAIALILIAMPKNNTTLNFASLDNETLENYLLTSDIETTELNNLITNTTAFENVILEETLNNVPLEDYLYNNSEIDDFNLE